MAPTEARQIEATSLRFSLAGYLFMTLLGLGFAILTHSEAILLDGAYSFISALTVLLAQRVTRLLARGDSPRFPFGYAQPFPRGRGRLIVFVRHGETAANRDGRILGRSDVPLSDLGRVQARRTAAWLADEQPARIFASPLARARETAAAIAEACDGTVEIDERLVEMDFGAWDGRPMASMTDDAWRRWREDPSCSAPDGESRQDVRARIRDFCDARLPEPDAETIVAVTHVMPIKASVAWVLGVSDEVTWHAFVGLASLTRIAKTRRGTQLHSFGETAHPALRDPGRERPRDRPTRATWARWPLACRARARARAHSCVGDGPHWAQRKSSPSRRPASASRRRTSSRAPRCPTAASRNASSRRARAS